LRIVIAATNGIFFIIGPGFISKPAIAADRNISRGGRDTANDENGGCHP
jgi:hypothetical protein